MSTIDFFIGGPSSSDFEDFDYKRADRKEVTLIPNLKLDPSKIEKITKQSNINKRIVEVAGVKESGASSYMVDQVITIRGLSCIVRREKELFWKKVRNSTFLGVVKLSLPFFLISLAPQGAVPYFSSVALTALKVFSVATLSFLYTFGFYRFIQSQDQISNWADSVGLFIANERKKSYNEGFSYVLDHDLKGNYNRSTADGLLHPVEVQYLFLKDLNSWYLAIKKQYKSATDDVSLFLNNLLNLKSPLEYYALNYAYPQDGSLQDLCVRQNIIPYIEQYDRYKRHFADIVHRFSAQCSAITMDAKNRLIQNDANRSYWIAPFEKVLKDLQVASLEELDIAQKSLSEDRKKTDAQKEELSKSLCAQFEYRNQAYKEAFGVVEGLITEHCKQSDTFVNNWQVDVLRRLQQEKTNYCFSLLKNLLDLFQNAKSASSFKTLVPPSFKNLNDEILIASDELSRLEFFREDHWCRLAHQYLPVDPQKAQLFSTFFDKVINSFTP